MNYDEINNTHRDSLNMLESMRKHRGNLIMERDSLQNQIETIDAMIAAEEAKAQELGRHLPDVKMPSETMPMMEGQVRAPQAGGWHK